MATPRRRANPASGASRRTVSPSLSTSSTPGMDVVQMLGTYIRVVLMRIIHHGVIPKVLPGTRSQPSSFSDALRIPSLAQGRFSSNIGPMSKSSSSGTSVVTSSFATIPIHLVRGQVRCGACMLRYLVLQRYELLCPSSRRTSLRNPPRRRSPRVRRATGLPPSVRR